MSSYHGVLTGGILVVSESVTEGVHAALDHSSDVILILRLGSHIIKRLGWEVVVNVAVIDCKGLCASVLPWISAAQLNRSNNHTVTGATSPLFHVWRKESTTAKKCPKPFSHQRVKKHLKIKGQGAPKSSTVLYLTIERF